MKIKVWKQYEGSRAPRPIEEGEYDEKARKLFGLARFLIDNGNAVEVIPEPVVNAAQAQDDYEKPPVKLASKPVKRTRGKRK
jgi:hypothetical protein